MFPYSLLFLLFQLRIVFYVFHMATKDVMVQRHGLVMIGDSSVRIAGETTPVELYTVNACYCC